MQPRPSRRWYARRTCRSPGRVAKTSSGRSAWPGSFPRAAHTSHLSHSSQHCRVCVCACRPWSVRCSPCPNVDLHTGHRKFKHMFHPRRTRSAFRLAPTQRATKSACQLPPPPPPPPDTSCWVQKSKMEASYPRTAGAGALKLGRPAGLARSPLPAVNQFASHESAPAARTPSK